MFGGSVACYVLHLLSFCFEDEDETQQWCKPMATAVETLVRGADSETNTFWRRLAGNCIMAGFVRAIRQTSSEISEDHDHGALASLANG